MALALRFACVANPKLAGRVQVDEKRPMGCLTGRVESACRDEARMARVGTAPTSKSAKPLVRRDAAVARATHEPADLRESRSGQRSRTAPRRTRRTRRTRGSSIPTARAPTRRPATNGSFYASGRDGRGEVARAPRLHSRREERHETGDRGEPRVAGPARDRRQSREGIRERLIQLSNPDVSKADRFTGIGMGLQFDGGGIELLVKRLSDV